MLPLVEHRPRSFLRPEGAELHDRGERGRAAGGGAARRRDVLDGRVERAAGGERRRASTVAQGHRAQTGTNISDEIRRGGSTVGKRLAGTQSKGRRGEARHAERGATRHGD